ncbi:unnamed protein product, partial [Aphanomyces euteiches]
MRLTTFVCGGSSWNEIKTKIFSKYKAKCLGLAKRNDDGAWSIADGDIEELDFDKIFSFRHGTHVKKLDNDAKMNEWLVSM